MLHRSSLRRLLVYGLLAVLLPLLGCVEKPDATPDASKTGFDSTLSKDVPYITTSQRIVERMLRLAEVSEDDVVYDLGSGDGRFVITAAQQFGARGVGVEVDPQLIRESRSKARLAGVSDRVSFHQGDLFEADLHEASVVTLYLDPELNLRLRPKLLHELDPGDRVVSHDFDMGAWTPDRVVETDGSTIYRWTIPQQVPDSLVQS